MQTFTSSCCDSASSCSLPSTFGGISNQLIPNAETPRRRRTNRTAPPGPSGSTSSTLTASSSPRLSFASVCESKPTVLPLLGRRTVAAAAAALESLEERLPQELTRLEHLAVARPPRRLRRRTRWRLGDLDDLHVLGADAVRVPVRLDLSDRIRLPPPPPEQEAHRYIRKMPNVVSGIGAFSAAERPSASTRRVSSGSMIPSSQSRAVE